MMIEDFVMLGKTVPEPSRDGRVFVCSAGVSRELRGLIRVYPLAFGVSPARWKVCRMPLERNPQDSRPESWKLQGDRSPEQHPRINSRQIIITGEVPVDQRADLLAPYVVASIAEANARRISLAVVFPTACPELTFKHNPDSPDSPQLSLFDGKTKVIEHGSKRFAFNPYLRFHDKESEHRLQLRDWGCYEFLRKQGDDRRLELGGALHLSAESSLLVGNLNRHRNVWCVISVLSHVRRAEPLFDLAEVS